MMARLSTAGDTTTTVTEDVKLSPKVKAKLTKLLSQYADVHAQMHALDARKKSLTLELEDLRADTGEGSLRVEGYGTVTLVAPTYSKFNEKLFASRGGDLDLYRQCVELHPKKAYTRVFLPSEKDGEDRG